MDPLPPPEGFCELALIGQADEENMKEGIRSDTQIEGPSSNRGQKPFIVAKRKTQGTWKPVVLLQLL